MEKKKHSKQQRAMTVCIEGNKMPLQRTARAWGKKRTTTITRTTTTISTTIKTAAMTLQNCAERDGDNNDIDIIDIVENDNEINNGGDNNETIRNTDDKNDDDNNFFNKTKTITSTTTTTTASTSTMIFATTTTTTLIVRLFSNLKKFIFCGAMGEKQP